MAAESWSAQKVVTVRRRNSTAAVACSEVRIHYTRSEYVAA